MQAAGAVPGARCPQHVPAARHPSQQAATHVRSACRRPFASLTAGGKIDRINFACGCGGTAYTTDLKSVGESLRVQIPPAAPRRSKLYIACSDFFQKSERAHAAAPPFQIEPTSLGFDLVLGANPEVSASILLRCSKCQRSRFCIKQSRFPCFQICAILI